MSDVVTTARSARESLARGLNALQSDPNVPPQLLELAAPIAQAMGALHQIERTGQPAPHADLALNNVRSALGQLQAQPSSHPAIMEAMEAVASSLGLVHALTKMGPAPQPQAQPYAQPQQYAQPQAEAPRQQPTASFGAPPQQPPPQQQQGGFAQQRPQQGGFAPDPFAAPQQSPFQPQAQPPQAGAPAPAGDAAIVNAELGAHSPTNFFKGLSGNDIIDHGGLFVSTYKIPRIGTPVRLRVHLPGGYEFEANAVVQWSREAAEGNNDAPPGFGARFTEITAEARQLVYRYVRNREPLFHDDL